MYEQFVKVTRTYTLPHNDYNPLLQETMFDFATTLQINVKGMTQKQPQASRESEIPKSLSYPLIIALMN